MRGGEKVAGEVNADAAYTAPLGGVLVAAFVSVFACVLLFDCVRVAFASKEEIELCCGVFNCIVIGCELAMVVCAGVGEAARPFV